MALDSLAARRTSSAVTFQRRPDVLWQQQRRQVIRAGVGGAHQSSAASLPPWSFSLGCVLPSFLLFVLLIPSSFTPAPPCPLSLFLAQPPHSIFPRLPSFSLPPLPLLPATLSLSPPLSVTPVLQGSPEVTAGQGRYDSAGWMSEEEEEE